MLSLLICYLGVFFATTPARAQLTWKEGELIIPNLLLVHLLGVFFATTPARAQLKWKEGESSSVT